MACSLITRLRGLLHRKVGDAAAEALPARWVVIDLETSGLDPATDRVLSVGAVAVDLAGEVPRILLRDSLELVVAQEAASERANILVHGIGEQAQLQGIDPVQAALALREYLADSPLVAFHAAFDRAFLAKAMKQWTDLALANPWVDAAELAPALHAQGRARALDDWLACFEIPVDRRHNASADALATAMLFLRLLAEVPAAERNLRGLQKIASHARWLPGA